MKLSPDTFNSMTPVEFIYAWIGWSDLQQSNMRQAWERERWSVWVQTTIQMDRKDRLPITQMFPLPWETQAVQDIELSMDERRERVKNILKPLKDES